VRSVRAAVPTAAPRAASTSPDRAETLRGLTELHWRGVLTDAEFEALRADLGI
jgi:hypothetical protein